MGLIPDHPTAAFDALVIGRAGMDLYPLPDGTRTDAAATFASDLGGSAGNIAVALARHGMRVALAAPVSDDPVGEFVARKIADYGITHATPEPVTGDPRTSLALAETIADGSRTVIYRNNAADFQMPPLDDALVASARVTIVTGTALARDPSRSVALQAMAASPYAVLDLDYRPYSWGSEAAEIYGQAADAAALIVGNEEEFDIIGGRQAAETRANHQQILYKKGSDGSEWLGAEPITVTPFRVEALKPFGAGDAYLGGTLARLMAGDAIAEAFRFGSAAAALVVAKRGCASAMPTTDDVNRFLAAQEG